MRVFLQNTRPVRTTCATLLRRFVLEEDAQDLVEYACGAAFVGIVGYLALTGITDAVSRTYAAWLSPSTGVPSLWDPSPPSGS